MKLKKPPTSLIPLSDLKQRRDAHVVEGKEIRLKISRPIEFKLGRALSIDFEEASLKSIVAVDVSTVKIGISRLGEVHAIRGSTVLKERGVVKINRTRPMIVLGGISDSQISFELEEQLKNISSIRNSIMLLDGDLNEMMNVSGPLGLPGFLASACNTLVSVSKRFVDPFIRLPEDFDVSPFVGEILNGRSPREYLVRLKPGSPLLKVEVYPEVELEEVRSLLASLILIDGVDYGYPEALRIAHIYSKILPLEVLTLKCILQKKFGIEVLREIDNRKMLLGGFWS
ncbi:MAG: DNA double-strand break repair nuclease NurA [Crenarchaeota archaeon]|nr:DNA double-strand break repair nuclease NurA [Thermoproteota archaeon]